MVAAAAHSRGSELPESGSLPTRGQADSTSTADAAVGEPELEYIRPLGSGAHGAVYLARLEGDLVAVKKIPLYAGLGALGLPEAEIMSKLHHPCICQLYGVRQDPDAGEINLIMEYLPGGPLLELASDGTSVSPVYSEAAAAPLFRQLASALRHLHENNLVHCDIKPANVLLSADLATAKLADFGVSLGLMGPSDAVPRANGTPVFLPPEACVVAAQRDGTTNSLWGKAMDVWALGVTLYCMLLGRLPFKVPDIPTPFHTMRAIAAFGRAKFDQAAVGLTSRTPPLSRACRRLLRAVLCADPLVRPSAASLLAHPWVTGAPDTWGVELDAEPLPLPISPGGPLGGGTLGASSLGATVASQLVGGGSTNSAGSPHCPTCNAVLDDAAAAAAAGGGAGSRHRCRVIPTETWHRSEAAVPKEAVRVRVLVADDVYAARKQLEHHLTALRLRPGVLLEVAEACDGAAALAAATAVDFDVVFLDAHMPELNGVAATRAIRSTEAAACYPSPSPLGLHSAGAVFEHDVSAGRQPAYVVVVAAEVTQEIARAARAAGANDFLSKPVSPASLHYLFRRLGLVASLQPTRGEGGGGSPRGSSMQLVQGASTLGMGVGVGGVVPPSPRRSVSVLQHAGQRFGGWDDLASIVSDDHATDTALPTPMAGGGPGGVPHRAFISRAALAAEPPSSHDVAVVAAAVGGLAARDAFAAIRKRFPPARASPAVLRVACCAIKSEVRRAIADIQQSRDSIRGWCGPVYARGVVRAAAEVAVAAGRLQMFEAVSAAFRAAAPPPLAPAPSATSPATTAPAPAPAPAGVGGGGGNNGGGAGSGAGASFHTQSSGVMSPALMPASATSTPMGASASSFVQVAPGVGSFPLVGGGGFTAEVACSSSLGGRATMEDAFTATIQLDSLCFHGADCVAHGCHGAPLATPLVAVFDGAIGPAAASIAAAVFPSNLCGALRGTPPAQAMRAAFALTHAAVVAEVAAAGSWSGTTALAAVLVEGVLHIGCAGNSLAVLCRDGDAVVLTPTPHTALVPAEKSRVVAAGGALVGMAVNGVVPTTRGLGFQGRAGVGVSPEPECVSHVLDTARDSFLLLATDGLWDGLGPSEAVRLVAEAFSEIASGGVGAVLGSLGGMESGMSLADGESAILSLVLDALVSEAAARRGAECDNIAAAIMRFTGATAAVVSPSAAPGRSSTMSRLVRTRSDDVAASRGRAPSPAMHSAAASSSGPSGEGSAVPAPPLVGGGSHGSVHTSSLPPLAARPLPSEPHLVRHS